MILEFRAKDWVIFIIILLLLTDVLILLDIPVLRQIFGLFFLTILPGLLILQIFKLDKLELVEKLVLSVGLSISFLMLFGVLVNIFLLNLGNTEPLSTISILTSFNIVFIKHTHNLNITILNLVYHKEYSY